ncbi:MAG TPA: hypothetical protein VK619_08360, partial [Pyrinomonadaceae bacterium]|nr:hypothetical protein [Pyrinomonadaceae bacterium]
MKRVTYLLLISLTVSGFVLYGKSSAQDNDNVQSRSRRGPDINSRAVEQGESIPVVAMPLYEPDRNERHREHPVKPLPLTAGQTRVVSELASAVQAAPGPQVSTTGVTSFDGVGIPNYNVNAAPPDTNGAVGADAPLGAGQYVQWVNEAFAVYRKSDGVLLKGPVAGNSLWAGFAQGRCSTNNDGDPIAQYDKINNRWIMTQFSVTGGPPYYQCVAVSKTNDALGAYNLYAFQYSDFNDYPKLSVWPDGYYITYNMFHNGISFSGGWVCALD